MRVRVPLWDLQPLTLTLALPLTRSTAATALARTFAGSPLYMAPEVLTLGLA